MLLEQLVAHEHTGPDGPQPVARTLHLALPPNQTSPSTARAAITASCRHWGLAHMVPTAELVVSELVTNVVRHAWTPLILAAEHDGAHLTVVVADGDCTLPALTTPTPMSESGHGVGVVGRLATGWGVQRTTLGKLVWASLSTTPDTTG